MDVEGHAIVLHKQARKDAKRYANLFKKHVEANNSHYKIVVTNRTITIGHDTAGITESIGIYSYTPGVAKALYCRLVLHKYNMIHFMEDIGEFTPFLDSEYILAARTPEPHESLKLQFRQVDGKWC